MPADPSPPADPRPPRLLLTGAALDAEELDEEYPDVDGVDLADEVVSLPSARTLDLLRCRMRGGRFELPEGCAVQLRDCELEAVDLTGLRIGDLTRVALRGCRLGGLDLGGGRLEDVSFDDCALDLASWRQASLERVAIRGGRIDGLDLSGARLTDVRVAGVALADATTAGIRCERVDLTGADIDGVTDVSALAGATISDVQAVALSARLAQALGLGIRRQGDAFPAATALQ